MIFKIKRRVKKRTAANGNVGCVKLGFLRNSVKSRHHVGQRRTECKQNNEFLVFRLDLGEGKHLFAVKAVTANEAVGSEKVSDLNTESIQNLDDLIRAVSHSVHDDGKLRRPQMIPKIFFLKKRSINHGESRGSRDDCRWYGQ